jgi:hypothetical protein
MKLAVMFIRCFGSPSFPAFAGIAGFFQFASPDLFIKSVLNAANWLS